jgi:hypothetical protein
MTDRVVRCRSLDQCTAEAVDPEGEIKLCQVHLAAAMQLAGAMPGVTIILEHELAGDGR